MHDTMGRMPDDHNLPGGISTRLVSLSANSADPPGVNDYDSFAAAYTAANENIVVNAYYERPAMLELAGDVAGRRILDAGCGSGPLFAALRDRGAIVTGFDKSAGMVELARLQRICGTARPGSRPIISRPTTTSLSGPWAARLRCCVSGPGRCMR